MKLKTTVLTARNIRSMGYEGKLECEECGCNSTYIAPDIKDLQKNLIKRQAEQGCLHEF